MTGILEQNKILILEDDELLRRGIALALEMHHFEVHQAAHGKQGLDVLNQVTPDLILSDINMPVMNGLEFLTAIKQNPYWTQIPFIFLTGKDASEEIQTGHELGVEDYITKPIQPDSLLRIINARLLRAAEVKAGFFNQAFLQTVLVLANTIEGRDEYTHGHVERVARYATWFCKALDWPMTRLQAAEYGARLHDIGKITIPDEILNKPGKLTPEEWELMKKHTLEGARIVSQISLLKDALPYILYHHEKWNGGGYPEGLAGNAIPIEGRMLAIVDVFDALTTERPYRAALSVEEAAAYIAEQAGTEFDPDMVPVFLEVVEANIKPVLRGSSR